MSCIFFLKRLEKFESLENLGNKTNFDENAEKKLVIVLSALQTSWGIGI